MSSSWLAEREFTWMFCGAIAGARERRTEELIVTSRTSSYPGCNVPFAEGPRTGSVYATSQLTELALEASASRGSLRYKAAARVDRDAAEPPESAMLCLTQTGLDSE